MKVCEGVREWSYKPTTAITVVNMQKIGVAESFEALLSKRLVLR
jgi:hypothetical protein